MNKTAYKIFWMAGDVTCSAHRDELADALKACEDLRTAKRNGQPISFITMCCENIDQVGEMGCDAVEGKKLPNGEDYTWSKAHRAGATRGVPYSIIDNKSNGE
jgi:hypothetical protein